MNEVRVCGGRRETYLWMRSRGVWASFPTSHFHHFHPQWTDEAVHSTPQPSRELNPSESIICLVNTKLLLNEPELMQLLPKLNLLANCSRGAARKTHTANKQISTRPAEKKQASDTVLPGWRPLIEKKTSNNKLYSYWSKSQSLPLWISPFNINLLVTKQLY